MKDLNYSVIQNISGLIGQGGVSISVNGKKLIINTTEQ